MLTGSVLSAIPTKNKHGQEKRAMISKHTGEPHKAPAPAWMRPMLPRSRHEEHRAATSLELLFDLVVVIAVAQDSSALHHGIAAGNAAEATLSCCCSARCWRSSW
jgi:hypothetical protein